MTPLVVLLAASPTVVVHVAEVSGVDRATAEDLTSSLCDAVELRTRASCEQSEAEWQTCSRAGPCLDALRETAGASEILLVRFLGGEGSILMSAERFIGGADPSKTNEPKNFNVDRRQLSAVRLNRLVDKLFPSDLSISSTSAISLAVIQPAEPINWAPWVVAGLSVAAGAGAVRLGLASRSSRRRAESNVLSKNEHASVLGAQKGQATAANALIGVASATAVAAIVWWILDG